MRGTNRYLPDDIAVQWCRPVTDDFHARDSALGRRYAYLLLESPVRPALESGRVGWTFRPLDGEAMRRPRALLIGEHDFSAFRSAECQAPSPVKTMRSIAIERRGAYWRFDFDANAFLHHMVRNIMGCLVAVGSGARTPAGWPRCSRHATARAPPPTFAPDGLYFVGPYYDPRMRIPERTAGHRLAALSVGEARVDREPADAHQDLRRHARGRRRRRRRRRRRCDRPRLLSDEPALRDALSARARAGARACRPSSRRSACSSMPRRPRSTRAARAIPRSLLQFHGDETPDECDAFGRPYLRAARMAPGLDLLDFAAAIREAPGLLLDAHVEGYGGGGKVFDWSLIPSDVPLPVVLSGGLHAGNVDRRDPARPALGR